MGGTPVPEFSRDRAIQAFWPAAPGAITLGGAGIGAGMTAMQGRETGRRALPQGGLSLAVTGAAGAARAQTPAWPDRPVRVIVPFPPGSTPDVAARAVAAHFARVFGQPFVAENRPGAGGTIGTDAIAKARDGHVIGVTINAPVTTAKALYPQLPYDPARDLAYVSLLVRGPQFLAVHLALPAQDLAGFIAHAKANPGRLSFGSVGNGSASHLAMEELKARAGIALTHVPYRGFPDAVIDLVAGRIEAMFVIASAVLPQLREGQARALAVSARLAEEARAALQEPRTRIALESAGFEVVASGAEDFTRFAAAETERWGALVRRLGLSAE